MLQLEIAGQFRKDYRRAKMRGYDINLLKDVIQTQIDTMS